MNDSELEPMNGNSNKTNFRQIFLEAIEQSERSKYGSGMLK